MDRARLPAERTHKSKQAISLRVDVDVLEWFRAAGPGYQTRMLEVLRRHVHGECAKGTANSAPTHPGSPPP